MFKKWHDECGIFAVFGHRFAANMAFFGLHALQHRGQEACGICTPEDLVKGMGLVTDVFPDEKSSRQLKGSMAIAHNRYSTQGKNILANAAPFERSTSFGKIAVVHNGHIINYDEARSFLERKGLGFNSFNDGELHLQMIAYALERNGGDYIKAIRYLKKKLKGAFSIILMTPNELYAYRDDFGFRPLALGKKNKAYFLASETCALDICGARYIRDIEPGEIMRINKKGIESFKDGKTNHFTFCIFELIYFAHPNSKVFGISVWKFRKLMGQQMAHLYISDLRLQKLLEQQTREDIIICPIPDTAIQPAQAFCQKLGLSDRLEFALTRSHYVGRTFIQPEQIIRDLGVRLKFAPIRELINGKIVVLIDDSIVRGSTSRKIVRMLKRAGARMVILIIYSPQIIGPCHMGIDTPDYYELIANTKGDPQKVAKYLTADYLLHCQIPDLKEVIAQCGKSPENFCYACFSRKYPFPVPE